MATISDQPPRDPNNLQTSLQRNEISYQGRKYAVRVYDSNNKRMTELPESLLTLLQEEMSKQEPEAFAGTLLHLDIGVNESGGYFAHPGVSFVEALFGPETHLEMFVVSNEIELLNWQQLAVNYGGDLEKMFQEHNITDPNLKFYIIRNHQLWQGDCDSFCKNLSQLGLTNSQCFELAKLIAYTHPNEIFKNIDSLHLIETQKNEIKKIVQTHSIDISMPINQMAQIIENNIRSGRSDLLVENLSKALVLPGFALNTSMLIEDVEVVSEFLRVCAQSDEVMVGRVIRYLLLEPPGLHREKH